MMSPEETLRVAEQLQREGKLEHAESLLNQILASNPAHAYALHLLGVIAYQVGKVTLATQLIAQAIQNDSQVALFHSNLGEMHRQLKAIDLSIQCGQQAVTLDPNSANAWSNLGITYYDAKQYEQAKNCHQRALAINPRLSCSLNNLGSIYKAQDHTTLALEFYQAAISASPHFADPLNNLGVLFLQKQEFKQAWSYLNQAIVLAPTFADAHCNLGLTLLGLEQSANALLHFEKALQLKPDYAEAYYGCAKVYLHQHNFTESERSIRQAIRLNPEQVEFYQLLADIGHEQGHYTQALMHLDQALAMDPTVSNLYLSKGNVLMGMGEIAQAKEQFLKVTSDPNLGARVNAHYSLIQLAKVKPDSRSLHALLSITKDLHALSPESPRPTGHRNLNDQQTLEYLYFALGKCFDDIGEWTKAFQYFSEGCRLKRQRIHYNIAEPIQLAHKLIHGFTQQTIEHLQPFANPSALPIFIVGMPRSGSTLVEQILSEHSHVYGAGELKYLNTLIQRPIKNQFNTLYYPDNIVHLSPEICRAIPDSYVAYLQHHSPQAIRITDKMPYNFVAIGLIHALLPNAKIIHVKRNPMDTCLSCYTKLFSEGQLYSYELTELGQYYQCYERIMNHWRRILPSDTWLDIEYETMVHNLEAEAQRLIKFCDLAWEPSCLNFYQSKRQVRTASFVQVRQPIYTSSVERWRRYEQELAPLIRVLESPYS